VLWPPAMVLHVKAADTKVELDHVELVRRGRDASFRERHPGEYSPKDVVLASATSPIVLDLDRVEKEPLPGGLQDYYARSPGREWRRVSINFIYGGEKTVLLDPGADLDVVLSGIDAPKEACLRLRRRIGFSESLEGQIPIAGRKQILVESLPTGRHAVSVEMENESPVPVTLASADVDLPRGERTTVTLELRPLAPPVKVPFGGVVVIPEEWGLSPFRLQTELVRPVGGTDRFASLKRAQIKR